MSWVAKTLNLSADIKALNPIKVNAIRAIITLIISVPSESFFPCPSFTS